MATVVDQRIVAAKFDASDFEKGVNKTIKKLDELKESLDLKEATKGVKDLAEKTEASTDSIGKSLEKLTDRFTNFTGMIKQRILGGLADEVANVFLKMERSVVSFIKSISSDQIDAGMQKYQSMLTSVRQMVNAGYDQKQVYEMLERTQTYSDETSYSFEQMADAMSKMVAAGVDLDTAGKSVEGIANACANAGVNARDAQRAFFNLSQAYSSGVLKYTDYRSLELLNMTTREFKEQMLEAAVTAGTLTKATDKLGKTIYKTTNKKDKKVKAGKKINIDNMSDMLKHDWMNKEAMNQLFGSTYWMEIIDRKELEKLRKELGDEEFEKRFGKIATKAYQAAYEARSFLDVVNAIKDAVSTGWATTFEHLFGKLDEAKDFFTDLANSELADVIYKIRDYRNAILGFWDDVDAEGKHSGGKVFRDSILNIAEALGTLFKTFLQVLPGFKEFNEDEESANPILQNLGDKLYLFTLRVRDFTVKIKNAALEFQSFMNEPVMKDGPTRIEAIRTVFANLSSVMSIFGKLFVIALDGISKAFYTLSPVFDAIIIVLQKITAPLNDLKSNKKMFDDIEHSINNFLAILEPIAKVLGDIIVFLGDVAQFFVSMSIDTFTTNLSFLSDALGLFLELIGLKSSQQKLKEGEGVLDRIKKDFEGIKDACTQGLSAVNGFFTALLGDIKKILGITDKKGKKGKKEGGIFSGVLDFLKTNQFVQDASAWLDQAIKDIKKWFTELPDKIINGVGKAFDWVNSIFESIFGDGSKQNNKDKKNENGKKAVKSKFETFIEDIKKNVKEFFDDLPNKIRKAFAGIGNFITRLLNAIDEFLFGKKMTTEDVTLDKKGKRKITITTTRVKKGFSKWLDGVIREIKKFVLNIPEYIKSAIKGAGDIITAIVNALFGRDSDGKKADGKDVQKELEKPFEGINLTWIINKIKEIGQTIIGQIIRIFTGSEDVEYNQKWFAEKIGEGIAWIKEKAEEIWPEVEEFIKNIPYKIAGIFTGTSDIETNKNWLAEKVASLITEIQTKAEEILPGVLDFFSSLPTKIANLFSGESESQKIYAVLEDGGKKGKGSSKDLGIAGAVEIKIEKEKGPIQKAIESFAETIGGFIAGIPTAVSTFFTSAITEFGKLWDDLYNAIIGQKEDGTDAADAAAKDTKGQKSKWDEFVESLGTLISTAFKELPRWVGEGLHMAVEGLNSVLGSVIDWLKGENAAAEMEKAAKEAQKKAEEGIKETADGVKKGSDEAAKDVEDNKDDNLLLNVILGIGQSLYNLITTSIPAFISEAWKWLGTQAELIWNGLSSIFSGQPNEKEKKSSAESIGGTIRRFLREELPAKIKAAWESIKRLGIDIWEGVSSIFTNKMPSTERGQAIANIVEGIKETLLGAINAIGKLFDKEDPLERNLNLLDPAQRAYYSRYADKMKKDSKNANKELDSNNESFVSRLGKSLLEAFRSIGPTILNGLSDAIDWIGKVISVVIDAITGEKPIGDQVEAAYGKEKPELVKALKRIGESLKKFFLESIPKFIGSAIGALVREAPKWFGQLFEGFSKAEKSEEDKAKQELEGGGAATDFDGKHVANSIMDTILGFFEKIKHFTDTFVDGDIIGVVAIIVAITILLSKMKDLFSLAREAEAAGDIVKWVALTVAFSAIASLVTTISDLMKSDDIAKSARVDKFMGDLKDLFGLIKEIVTWLSVGKIADAVGEIAEAKGKGKTIELAGEGLGSIFGGFFSNFFSMAGIGAGAYIGGGLLSAAIDTTIGTITEALTSLTSGIDDMITMIEPFTNKLAGINETLTTAIDSVEKIKTLFITFYHVFDDMWNEMTGLKDIDPSTMDEETFALTMGGTRNPDGSVMTSTTNKEAFLKNLSARITLITQLSTFVNQLTDAISKIGDTKDFESKMNYLIGDNGIFAITERGKDKHSKFTDFLIKLFNSIQDAFSSTKLSRTGMNMTADIFRSTINDYAVILQIASDALSSFGSSLTGLNENNIAGLERSIDFFVRLAKSYEGMGSDPAIVKAFLGNDSLSHIGSQIKIFGQHMKKFFSYIENLAGFKEDQYSETMRKIDGITYLAQQMAKAMTWMQQFGSTSEFLATLGENLESFGGSVGVFFKAIDNALSADGENKITKERSETILNAVNSVATIITAIKSLHDMLSYKSQMDINTEFGKIFDAFSGEHGELNSSKLAEMIRAFDEAILTIMNSDNFSDGYVTVGENVSRKLFEGIQKAFDEDDNLRPTITPVLDTTIMEQQLKDKFGVDNIGNFDTSILASGVSGANNSTDIKINYTEKFNEVTKAIGELKDSQVTTANLISAFASMKIVTDTGVLAGEMAPIIDKKIGEQIMLINNNITTDW